MQILIRKVLELTVVLIKAFHSYKLCTKVTQHSSLKFTIICRQNQ